MLSAARASSRRFPLFASAAAFTSRALAAAAVPSPTFVTGPMKFGNLVTRPLLALLPLTVVESFYPSTRLHRAECTARIPTRTLATVASSTADAVDRDSDQQSSSSHDTATTVIALGTVVANQDGLLAVKIQDDDSQAGDLLGKQVILPNERQGMVVVHRPPLIFCYTDDEASNGHESGRDTSMMEGKVQVLSQLVRVAVGELAAHVDALGRPLGTTQLPKASSLTNGRAIFSPIPQVQDIALINSPVLTGLSMVDALTPLGRGQNMLWITTDNDVDSSRKYLLDWMRQLTSDKNGTPVIYAALDTDEATLAQFPEGVQIVKRTQPTRSAVLKAAEGVAMASTACALAEQHARDHGRHAVVIVDTLDGHKALWDATTRALVDVFGIDAVVQGDRDGGASSEMRAFYASLVQRSAQYKVSKGGGSVTLLLVSTIPPANDDSADRVFAESDFSDAPAKVQERIQWLVQKKIPLTEANLRKIQIPIPSDTEGRRRLALQHVEDLISMSDGQIWLDEDLAKAGQWPPMDPQRSVTRIGIGADTISRADAPALRKVVEGLRLLLSQAKDNLEGVSQSNAQATQKQIQRQKAILLALHQEPGTGARRLSESYALLLAASEGLLDQVVENDAMLAGQEAGDALVRGILGHLQETVPLIMQEIDETLDLTDEHRESLRQALEMHLS